VPRRIVLDCDPGHDDAVAILLAAGCPDIELGAITVVAGNQVLEKTALNARRVCSVAGIRDVPIAAGCAGPLQRELRYAADIHGESGLDGPSFPEPDIELDPRHGVDVLIAQARAASGDLTLVPVGPLTNVATALQRAPDLVAGLDEIVLMGGATTGGNATPAAEFNILVDPEAAQIVLDCGVPVTLVPLEVTHQALATPDVVQRIQALGTPLASIVVDLLTFFGSTYESVFGIPHPPVHDPVAVARVARPEIVTVREVFVAVETAGEWTAGETVVDWHGVLHRPANARIATELDVEAFWALVVDALRRLG
jgi:purine nucleosidase